jgi:hypothetical protein
MTSKLTELFADASLVEKVKRRLPHLFHYAERDSSRAGRVGMEVGSLRERILVALLIHKFGRPGVETDLPITLHDVDVTLFGDPISVKTLTTGSRRIGPVKAVWTVDAESARQFVESFEPASDYLIAHLVWDDEGGLYYVPVECQRDILRSRGREVYLRLPRPGTNPRGVEVSSGAMAELVSDPRTLRVPIRWRRPTTPYDQYERWIEYWRLD